MPKKRFEERPYDPISTDLFREATTPQLKALPPTPNIALVPPKPASRPIVHEASITKRFVLTRSEDADVEAFILRLQNAARTKVSLGVLMRAALSVIMESEAQLIRIVEAQTFRLPSTHDRLALGEFEDQWRRCLGACAVNR